MSAALMRLAKEAHRRAFMAIGRGVLAAIDDSQTAQSLQLTLLDGETADEIERFQNYGFTSVPFAGAEAVMVAVGGLRSHGIVVAVEDRRYRLTGLPDGEVALYDDQGQVVHLTRTGIVINSAQKVTVSSAAEVDVTAPSVVITSNNVQVGAAGGKKIVLDGDSVVAGKVVSSATKAFAT